jgi:hypothetical protein
VLGPIGLAPGPVCKGANGQQRNKKEESAPETQSKEIKEVNISYREKNCKQMKIKKNLSVKKCPSLGQYSTVVRNSPPSG